MNQGLELIKFIPAACRPQVQAPSHHILLYDHHTSRTDAVMPCLQMIMVPKETAKVNQKHIPEIIRKINLCQVKYANYDHRSISENLVFLFQCHKHQSEAK